MERVLSGVIDYAGIFPPAKLSLEDAVANYLGYLEGPDAWIVGRFVCSSARLEDLTVELERHSIREPIPVTVVGSGGSTRNEWESGLERDAGLLNGFEQRSATYARLEGYEVRIPSNEAAADFLLDLQGFQDVDVFVELPWGPGMVPALGAVAETEWIAAKARTGGLERSAIPGSEQLAEFLRTCSHLDLEFKLTAGLHEPFAHDDPDLGRMHGFLNVLGALALGDRHDLSSREIAEILNSGEGQTLIFQGDSVRWKEWEAGADDVQAARELFVSFGSCSIDEPVAGLGRAGLLTGAAR
jgi:hypothetical protein